MPEVVNVDDMVAQVRSRTDQQESTFIDDATEIIPWLTEGVAKIYKKIFDRDPNWFMVAGSVNTTSGTQEYTLPEDFLAMNSVTYATGGYSFELPEIPYKERLRFQNAPTGLGVGYRIQRSGSDGNGVRIRFEPDPGTRTFAYDYTPTPPVLGAGGQWDGIAGFAGYPIAYACALVREKADEDPATHYRMMASIEADVEKMAYRRNVGGGGPRIGRTRRRGGYRHRFPGVL